MWWKALVALAAVAFVPAADAARQPTLAGRWQRLPQAPAAASLPYDRAGVWTGRQLIVFGRAGAPGAMRNAAFSYTPATGRWRTLTPPRGPTGSYEGATAAVWTGRLMLVVGPFTSLSYEPATNRWRQLPAGPELGAPSGLLVWTGHELITWGGGCCGDVTEGGAAYDPVTRRWRTLPKAPVAGQQRPLGVWTGKELIVLPGRRADHDERTGGAAYDPVKNAWRRIASPPQERLGSTVVWDGKEVLVVGGWGTPTAAGVQKLVSVPYAYDPATNRWRTLVAMDGGYGRAGAGAAWTGTKLLLWGGRTQEKGGGYVLAPHGLAYDPATNRWWTLPGAPLNGRLGPVAVWTGKALLVWGGDPLRDQVPPADDWWPLLDGATFAPKS
jgi:hypothetical protein